MGPVGLQVGGAALIGAEFRGAAAGALGEGGGGTAGARATNPIPRRGVHPACGHLGSPPDPPDPSAWLCALSCLHWGVAGLLGGCEGTGGHRGGSVKAMVGHQGVLGGLWGDPREASRGVLGGT